MRSDSTTIVSEPERFLMNQDKHVLIVGKNSYVGEFLCDHFAAQGARLSAVGSSDCNFLDSGQVQEFFKDGKSHGMRTKYYSTGQRLSEANIVKAGLRAAFADGMRTVWWPKRSR